MPGLRIIHPLLFEEGNDHSATFFLRRTLRFGRCGYFLRFRRWLFRFSRVFLRCFRLRFFSPRKALSGSKLTFFADLTPLAAFFCLHRLFSLSRAPFLPTLRGARSLEIRLKVDFALVHINRFDANFHAIAQGDKSGRWIRPSGVAPPGQSDSSHCPAKRHGPDHQ